MIALRNILKRKGIYINEKTIQERRLRYELSAKPVECFIQDAIAEDSTEGDRILKETLYRAYEIFAKKNKLAVISNESLGKTLKHKFEDGREPSGKRKNLWKGVRLNETYSQIINSEQQTLIV